MKPTIFNIRQHLLCVICAALTLPAAAFAALPDDQSRAGGTFTAGQGTFLLNGKPFVVKAAELHYPRIPRPYWEHRIQMCKALGMNTICLYVFWNIHEPEEGHFDFSGNNDVEEFCRIAWRNGMYVILRPGPYVCAEWEMGGLPWWLLKKKDIRLRERDPYFMERVRLFEQEIGRRLAPLTIQRGGPVIMVQVENEYGSYGTDKAYVSEVRDILKNAGFNDVTLFQCDWASNFTANGLDDLVWTMNFGTGADIDEQFRRLGELRPHSPRMCSEFWSGWFDKWGARHETRPSADMVAGIDEMLSKGISFSLYMTHGGTSFGHWAGANSPGYAPDVTSYDYDAPINEYGLPTPKYHELRSVMAKHAISPLPDIPQPPVGIISTPETRLDEFAEIELAADSVCSGPLLTFEDMDMGFGQMIYKSTLPAAPSGGVLTVEECHDYGRIYVDGRYIGTIDRVKGQRTTAVPPTAAPSEIVILVEGMGRINFGRAIKDYKGITGRVTLTVSEGGKDTVCDISNWTNITLPDGYDTAIKALSRAKKSSSEAENGHFIVRKGMFGRAGFYRGHFNLTRVGDTFINMSRFGKGMLYVNGHAIGRYWSIGPQQTLYVPGCRLRTGENEVVVLDIIGTAEPTVKGQTTHELDMLRSDAAESRTDHARRPDTQAMTAVKSGEFAPEGGWQTVMFDRPATGRFIAIEGLNAQNGGNTASIAEVYAVDSDGKRLERAQWSAPYADSEDTDSGNHTADKAFDLQETTAWSTAKDAPYPHILVIDTGRENTIKGIEILPAAAKTATGRIREYNIYVY